MPKKADKKGDYKFEYVGYAGGVNLTGDEFSKAVEFYGDNDSAAGGIAELAERGYAVRITYDAYEDVWRVNLYGMPNSNNRGLILSSFAGTYLAAVAVTLWKIEKILEWGEWPQREGRKYG